MKRPSIELIHECMRDNGMVVFDKPFDATLGGIRTKDNESNTFNDWGFMSMFTDGGGIISIVAEITTDAGLFYRLNPIHVDGTAIIKHGVQHMQAYQYQNPLKNRQQRGHRGKEAFRQVNDMLYWRDADRDKYLDFDGETIKGNFATNGHDMGTKGADGQVNKWSAGCWGAEEDVMDLFYDMALTQMTHRGSDIFSYAMLHENMF